MRRKDGRVTLLTLNPGSLDDLATWAMSTRLMWSGLLDRFAASVEEPADPTRTKESDR